MPHSEISGSKLVRSSPKLIAAYHVLHRLSVPRHPPNALKTLDRSHCRYSPYNGKAIVSGITTPRQTFPKGKMSSSSRDGSSRACPRLAAPMISTRKTILLHHPSGSCALQDLSFAHAVGSFPRTDLAIAPQKFARGFASSPRYFPYGKNRCGPAATG